jgi:DNA primase
MLLERVNIENYFNDKAISYSRPGKNVASGWIGIKCPYCYDHANHCGINVTSCKFSCFLCGEKGGIVKLIAKLENTPFRVAEEIAKKYTDNIFADFNESENETIHIKQVAIPKGFTERFNDIHLNYLADRGFDADRIIRKFDLLASSITGDYRFRIFAPVYINRVLVNYQMRTVAHVEPKYISCKDSLAAYKLKSCLYNIDTVKKTVVLCEGITDVWKIGDGAVALFGKTITSEQILLLLKTGVERVVICLDSAEKDPDSPANSRKISNKLTGLFKFVDTLELDKGDPGDMSQQEINDLKKLINI